MTITTRMPSAIGPTILARATPLAPVPIRTLHILKITRAALATRDPDATRMSTERNQHIPRVQGATPSHTPRNLYRYSQPTSKSTATPLRRLPLKDPTCSRARRHPRMHSTWRSLLLQVKDTHMSRPCKVISLNTRSPPRTTTAGILWPNSR